MTVASQELQRIADAVVARLERDHPSFALQAGCPVRRLATLDPDRLATNAIVFAGDINALRAIDAASLTPPEQAFHAALVIDLERRVRAVPSRLLDFAITPYRGGDLHAEARAALTAHPLKTAADRDAYRDLIHDYGRLLREIRVHTEEQAAKGIRLAVPALPTARAMLDAVRTSVPQLVGRNGDAGATADALVAQELLPAIDALREAIGDSYEAQAPTQPGLGHLDGGADHYRKQIVLFTDVELSPETIHQIGLDMIEALQATKAALGAKLHPGLDLQDVDRRLRDDARSKARTAEFIEERFNGYMSRVEPLMPRWFLRQQRAPYAVTRADPAAEQGMSFGDYQRPTAADPVGRYRYNGSDPTQLSMLGAAHVIYHELLPGHHYQLSLQDEAEFVHPLQRHLLSMATIEGWAVYSSDLAAEMGAMDTYDLYGHAVMQGFAAARLVVDTGLNALGWTLKRAHAFMREHTAESDTTIASELLRYATDIPAQALAYALGGRAIRDLRSRAERALGDKFEARRFHDVLLAQGGYPLPVLGDIINSWIAGQRDLRR